MNFVMNNSFLLVVKLLQLFAFYTVCVLSKIGHLRVFHNKTEKASKVDIPKCDVTKCMRPRT